jgi:hypothetical protein
VNRSIGKERKTIALTVNEVSHELEVGDRPFQVVPWHTGKILYRSDMAGIDKIEDEDNLDCEQCVEIPRKNDLELGRHLVFEFVIDTRYDIGYNNRNDNVV